METCKSYCLRFTRRSNSEIEDGFYCDAREEAEDLFEAYSEPIYSAEENISIELIEIDWLRRSESVLESVCF